MLADMDGNTNDPWWTKILSCFKALGFRQFPFLASVLEKEGLEFLTHWRFMVFMTPSPAAISPSLLLARISRQGKQTNYKETNTTANKHVVTWSKRFQQHAGWEREREGRVEYNLFSLSRLRFLHFPLISSCPAVPSTLCDSPVGLSEEIISEHGQYETDGQMMDLTW